MLAKRSSCSRSSYDGGNTEEDESEREENWPVITRVASLRKKSYRKWIKDEDERLRDCIHSNGGIKDWSLISQHVGNGRTDAQCQHRWERFLDPSITKGPWTDEEDKKVIELVRDHGARQWSLIAKELKGRVGKQCRERWHNHLNPAINKNPWTNDENLLLFILHEHFGNKWAEIARHFNGRSDNSIKNHWNSSMKKKFESEVANLKRQGLEWTALIPPDFPWPKLDKSTATSSNSTGGRSSRIPLTTITNRTSRSRPSNVKKSSVDKKTTFIIQPSTSSMIQTDDRFANHMHDSPMVNSNSNHHFFSTEHGNFDLSSSTQHITTVYTDQLQPLSSSQTSNNTQEQHSSSSQELERMFYCTPPSPVKQLPMLSSCASYTPPSQNSQSHHHVSLLHSHTSSSLYSSLDYFQHPPSRSSSLPVYGASSPHSSPILTTQHPSYHTSISFDTHDDPFSLSFGSQHSQNPANTMIKQEEEQLLIDFTQQEPQRVSPTILSNSSSPSKHRILNTPERFDEPQHIRLTPSPKLTSPEQDIVPWLAEFLPLPPPTTVMHRRTTVPDNNKENRSSIRPTIVRRNKRLKITLDHAQNGPIKKRDHIHNLLSSSTIQFDPMKKIKDELGYNPTYTEIMMGQTRDQRHLTDQAKRFLSCSSLNNYTS